MRRLLRHLYTNKYRVFKMVMSMVKEIFYGIRDLLLILRIDKIA